MGERITTLPFTLSSDPVEPGIACTPFVATEASGSEVSVFDNGLPSARTDWLHDGVLARLRYHRAGAAKSGVAHGSLHRQPDPALRRQRRGSLDDMVARTERGLLLTCLWYIRVVDPATLLCTGLTRDGVYVIEDGKVVGRPTTSASTRARSTCWPGRPRSALRCARSGGSSANT